MRTATVVAQTPLRLISFNRNDFLSLLKGNHTAIERLLHIGDMRCDERWDIVIGNSVLKNMTSWQKDQLKSVMHPVSFVSGDVLWSGKDAATKAILLSSGIYSLSPGCDTTTHDLTTTPPTILTESTLIGNMTALLNQDKSGPYLSQETTLVCMESGNGWEVSKHDLSYFLENNPGVKLSLIDSHYAPPALEMHPFPEVHHVTMKM